ERAAKLPPTGLLESTQPHSSRPSGSGERVGQTGPGLDHPRKGSRFQELHPHHPALPAMRLTGTASGLVYFHPSQKPPSAELRQARTFRSLPSDCHRDREESADLLSAASEMRLTPDSRSTPLPREPSRIGELSQGLAVGEQGAKSQKCLAVDRTESKIQ